MSQTKAQLLDGKSATIQFTGGSASAPSVSFTGDTNTGIYSPGADQVAISTNGAARLTITSDGDIRTTWGNDRFLGSYFSSSYYQGLLFDGGNSKNLKIVNRSGDTSADIVFLNAINGAPTEKVRITSAGLVGVGTSSPSTRLHVRSSADDSTPIIRAQSNNQTQHVDLGFYYINYDNGATSSPLEFQIDGSTKMALSATGLGVGTTSPSTKLHVAGSGQQILRIQDTGNTNGFDLGNNTTESFISTADNKPITFYTNNLERAKIDSSGRVGIGTSTVTGYSSNIVHINGATGSEVHLTTGGTGATAGDGLTLFTRDSDGAAGLFQRENASLLFGTNDQTRVTITSGGSVGIGTNAPSAALHLSNASTPTFLITDTRTPVTAQYQVGSSLAFVGTTTNHDLGFTTNNTERARIDSSGRLLVGTSSPYAIGGFNRNTYIAPISGESDGQIVISATGAGTPGIFFTRTRGSTPTTYTVVQDGDTLGRIDFFGADGVDYSSCGARIAAQVDGTPGSDDLPSRLVFSTTADGASSPTERMRIQQNGFVKVANNGNHVSTTDAVHRFESDNANNPYLTLRAQNANYAGEGLQLRVNRAANSVYWFLAGQSSDGGDNEFVLKGDGNAFADGSWSGGGADYAEYFEWSDSNPSAEDRRGISVVLDGDKIREAQPGEDPIGVISGNPSVVGDAAWNKWSGKYLRDEYGTYTLNENGDRQLNPAYDPDVEYISREQRPEWDCVGLMGKLRIRKGQVTGSRWIKMRNISDSVEEWMVR